MNEEQKQKFLEMAKELPADNVKKIKEATASVFKGEGIPFDASHLMASKISLDLIMNHPTISVVTREYLCTLILMIIRIVDEMKDDSIISPMQLVK